jgi:alkanesulfonate monooxygenase SsuD/methylene tetrahydromethanopterin reductase-like flavin-dependent oxidoreductase (luciferase family)
MIGADLGRFALLATIPSLPSLPRPPAAPANGRMLLSATFGEAIALRRLCSHGTAFKSRWKLLRERIEAMKKLWTEDAASYHGEFVNFDPAWSWPKPVQKPHPPILMGSHGPRGMQRVIRYCDGWLPNAGPGVDLPKQIAELHRLAEQAGRDPNTISITAFAAPPDRKVLDQQEAAGAERAVFFLPAAGTDKVLPLLDEYAKLT